MTVDVVVQIAAIVLAIAGFLGHAWSARRMFKVPQDLPARARALILFHQVFFIATLLALTWPRATHPAPRMVGLAMYVLSLAIFWWTVPTARRGQLHIAYAPVHPEVILTSGPYRWIRHPFYLSYLLFWTAGALASGRVELLVAPLVMGYFYFSAIREEETRLLGSALGDEYSRYRARTGMLLPKVK